MMSALRTSSAKNGDAELDGKVLDTLLVGAK